MNAEFENYFKVQIDTPDKLIPDVTIYCTNVEKIKINGFMSQNATTICLKLCKPCQIISEWMSLKSPLVT